MSRLFLPIAIALGVLNVAYVTLDIVSTAPIPHSTQPLMVLGALTAVILWAVHHRSDQWDLGYSQGRLDTLREQIEAQESATRESV